MMDDRLAARFAAAFKQELSRALDRDLTPGECGIIDLCSYQQAEIQQLKAQVRMFFDVLQKANIVEVKGAAPGQTLTPEQKAEVEALKARNATPAKPEYGRTLGEA